MTKGAARSFGGGDVNQVIVELEGGFMFFMSISLGSSLAVVASKSSDVGLVGYEMSMLAERMGTVLSPMLVAELRGVPASGLMASSGSSRFVRQYALTQGRVRSTGAQLELDTPVQSTPLPPRRITPRPSIAASWSSASPLSVAEISAHLHLHLGIARVLVGDLVAAGHVVVSETRNDPAGPDLPTLERLLDDLQAL
ncbi:MAG: DUF742 domain-containing protein [Ilumatobacteraceae bacterium]